MTESSKESQSVQLPEFVRQSAIRAAVNLGFTPDKFHVRFEAGSNCDGLVGEIHRVTITEGNRQEDLFCKIPPLSAARREEFNSMTLFEREIILYSTVLPAVFEFQRAKNVPESEGFFNVPKCYLTLFDADSEESAILMENLSNKGYRMGKKIEPVDLDHARLVMTSLGRWHGLSLALKDQKPELFERFKLPDVLLPAVKNSDQLVAMFAAALENAISLLGPDDEQERTKMEALRDDHIQMLEVCLDGTKAEPYAVLNHGDCWINNLLYGYKVSVPRSSQFHYLIQIYLSGRQTHRTGAHRLATGSLRIARLGRPVLPVLLHRRYLPDGTLRRNDPSLPQFVDGPARTIGKRSRSAASLHCPARPARKFRQVCRPHGGLRRSHPLYGSGRNAGPEWRRSGRGFCSVTRSATEVCQSDGRHHTRRGQIWLSLA